MRLLLIRHAESRHRQLNIIAGRDACPGLSELGFGQCQRLVDRFQQSGEVAGCQVFLTSPVLRARQTAQALAACLPGRTLIEDENLTEIDPGEAEGLHPEEYEARYGNFDLQAFPDRPYAPGGETWNQFLQRVRAHLAHLADKYAGQEVLAVTHAGYLLVSTWQLFNVQFPLLAWLDPRNTGITEWVVRKGRWVLERYNDTAHLPRAVI